MSLSLGLIAIMGAYSWGFWKVLFRITLTVSLLCTIFWRRLAVLVLAGDDWDDFLCLVLPNDSVGEVCRERFGVTGELKGTELVLDSLWLMGTLVKGLTSMRMGGTLRSSWILIVAVQVLLILDQLL